MLRTKDRHKAPNAVNERLTRQNLVKKFCRKKEKNFTIFQPFKLKIKWLVESQRQKKSKTDDQKNEFGHRNKKLKIIRKELRNDFKK